jgi:hypothetical protein
MTGVGLAIYWTCGYLLLSTVVSAGFTAFEFLYGDAKSLSDGIGCFFMLLFWPIRAWSEIEPFLFPNEE